MTGSFGDSDLSGSFTVRDLTPRVHVSADLATRRLAGADASAQRSTKGKTLH